MRNALPESKGMPNPTIGAGDRRLGFHTVVSYSSTSGATGSPWYRDGIKFEVQAILTEILSTKRC